MSCALHCTALRGTASDSRHSANSENGATDHGIYGTVPASMAPPVHDGVLVPPAVYSTFNGVRGPAYGGTEYRCNNATVLH
jgi:hypothetical protein